MPDASRTNSARKQELLEAAYMYVLENGLIGLSLRPLAADIGTSPRVLLFLFGSKNGLITALLIRARSEETALREHTARHGSDLASAVRGMWEWTSAPVHRKFLKLWLEAYTASVAEPDGPLGGFARQTVDDRLAMLAAAQTPRRRRTKAGAAERRLALAVLRGAILDLVAAEDDAAAAAAVEQYVARLES